MAISTKGNLSNLCYLTEIGGVKVLRKVFIKRVVELKPDTEDPETWTVQRFLNMNIEKIESAKLTPESKLIIFPFGGKQTNLDLWDFSLFFYILKATCSLSPSMQINFRALKKIHDKIKYSKDLNIGDAKCKDYFDKLRYIFENTLNDLNDVVLKENIREMLEKSYAGQVPEKELSIALQARQRNFDEGQNIVIAELYETLQRIKRDNSTQLAVLKNIEELLTSTKFGFTKTPVPVEIKTPQPPDTKEHLTHSQVDMFNDEIKNIPGVLDSFSEDTPHAPKKFKTNGKKSDPHIQLLSMTDGYSDGDTERHDCTKPGNGITLRQFVVPSSKYRRYYYTYNNVQHIVKKYGNIVRAFNRSYEIDLPCFDDVNLFFFSGDTTVDLSVVDDASRENVKKPKFTTFGSIEEIVRGIDRLNENGVSIFISTKDIAERLDYIRFSPHIILVDNDKPKYLQFDEIQNVKVSSHHELAKNISSLLEDMLLKHLVKMIKVLEDILHVNSSSSSKQEASVSTDFHSEKENQGYGTQSSTTEDLKKVQDDAQELYEDILALFYRAGKPWKTAFQDMVKTLDNEIAKELLQVPGVTSVGYKLDVLNLFLDNSMVIEGRLLTENRLKCLLKKHRISRYEFHYEQGKPEQYAEVGSVLNVGQGEKFKGALGCFVKLGEANEMCILFSKHVSLRGTDLLIEDPLGSGILVRFATLLSSNRPDSGPLDIAIAKVFNPANHQVKFKDEFGKCLPSIVCLFDNLTWLHRLPVHISRAVGEPGLGIIIIPVLYMGDAKNICYLKIEDRDANKRFANPGDSGSIVCANDINDGLKVHIIAMLIGSSNEDEVNQSSTTKRQYVAFRLNMGVDQLKKELNKEICFYE